MQDASAYIRLKRDKDGLKKEDIDDFKGETESNRILALSSPDHDPDITMLTLGWMNQGSLCSQL